MKIKEGLYECDFCSTQIKQQVNRVTGNGRKGVGVSMVKCDCGNLVSQKTKLERTQKLERGEKC